MSKMIYQVLIIRRDGSCINAFESEEFDKSKERWKELKDQWVKNLKEQTAFELEEPIVTAFDPGLISEVTIAPVQEQHKENNPYKERMNRNGLGDSLQNFTGGIDGLKDNGYR